MNEQDRDQLRALAREHLQYDRLPEAVLALTAILADDRGIEIELTRHGRVIVHHHAVEMRRMTQAYEMHREARAYAQAGDGDDLSTGD